MSSHTLAKDRQPNSHEIAKAVVLSSLAYLDNQSATATVERRYSEIGFERILMAPHFILGFDPKEYGCNTTLYVAFRRRLSIQDMFAVKVADRSEFIDSYGEAAKDVEGLFHSELFNRITSELPSMSHFQNYKANKIIFSGHGVAGALAHLFLICYMIMTREEDREHISIGFGSPYFCDDSAKRFCRKTMELDRRMFTFVNDADPVPWMLEGIRMTCTPESVGRTIKDYASLLGEIDKRREIMSSVCLAMYQLGCTQKEMHIMPRYVSVGMYCDERRSTLRGSRSILPNSCPESVRINFDRFTSIIQQVFRYIFSNQAFQVDSWQCHKVESYVEKFASNANREGFPSKPVMDIAPNPCIDACTLSIYNGETSYEGVITIRGSHLSDDCHENPIVEPNVGHGWKVEDARKSSVLLKGVLPKIEADAIYNWKKDEIVEQGNLSLKLRTCFGSTHKDVHVEDSWKDGYVASALARVMGKLLLMQQSEVLSTSDRYKKAFKTLERGFPDTLGHLSYSIPETKRKHFDIMKSLLTRPVEIPFQDSIIMKCGLYLSTSGSSHPELSSVIPDYAYISKFFHGSYFSVYDGGIRILNYRDIVRAIYCLLNGTELQDDQSDVYYYERELYSQGGGQAVKRRESLPEVLQADIEERSGKMFKIITACNSLESLRFATFIGPENAGKTTLINSILGENVGDVGFTTHTRAATPYRFTDDIFLVDFPGTDGGGDRAHLSTIWEEYEKVANLCVIVLNFGGDTSRAGQVFPRIARSQMWGGDIVLVINRVDSVLNGSRNSPVWAEYSPEKVKQLKISIAKNSGLPAERVFFSVLRTNEELEETTCQLLRERSILLKDEITSTVRELIGVTLKTSIIS